MRSSVEIAQQYKELIASEEDFEQKIKQELAAPKMTDEIANTIAFYQSLRKQIAAKLELLKWIMQ